MGVIKVPTAESRMGPGELPNFRAHSNASPEAFGSGVAKATQNLGAVVGEVAGLVEKYDDIEAQREAAAVEAEHEEKLFNLMYGELNEEGNRVGGLYNDPNVSPEERVRQAEGLTKELQSRRYKHGRTAGYLGNRLEKGLYGFASQAATIKMRQDEKAEANAKVEKNKQFTDAKYNHTQKYVGALQNGDLEGAKQAANDLSIAYDVYASDLNLPSTDKPNSLSGLHFNGLKDLIVSDPRKAIELQEHYRPSGTFYKQMNDTDQGRANGLLDSAINGLAEMEVYEKFKKGNHDYPDFHSFIDAQKDVPEEVRNNAKRNAPLLENVYYIQNPKQTAANNEALNKH